MKKETEMIAWMENEEGAVLWDTMTETQKLHLAGQLSKDAAEAVDMELKECRPAAACSRDNQCETGHRQYGMNPHPSQDRPADLL